MIQSHYTWAIYKIRQKFVCIIQRVMWLTSIFVFLCHTLSLTLISSTLIGRLICKACSTPVAILWQVSIILFLGRCIIRLGIKMIGLVTIEIMGKEPVGIHWMQGSIVWWHHHHHHHHLNNSQQLFIHWKSWNVRNQIFKNPCFKILFK